MLPNIDPKPDPLEDSVLAGFAFGALRRADDFRALLRAAVFFFLAPPRLAAPLRAPVRFAPLRPAALRAPFLADLRPLPELFLAFFAMMFLLLAVLIGAADQLQQIF